MKFRFILENIETGEKVKYKTLKDVSEHLNIDYHQARSVSLSGDKQFLHPVIKNICKSYKIYKNTENN